MPLAPFQAHFIPQGDVLEVSAGTGRNLPFYTPKQLSSLTLTDSSKSMLFFAREKAAARKKLTEAVPLAVHLSDAGRLAAPDDASGAVAGAVCITLLLTSCGILLDALLHWSRQTPVLRLPVLVYSAYIATPNVLLRR